MKKFLLMALLVSSFFLQAQSNFAKQEKELHKMAFQILNHDSLTFKIEQNKKFAKQLIALLHQPDSYNYDFDSLKTLSILRSDDNSFRIFTWYIVDKNYNEMYGEQHHYYFGLVQRNMPDPKNPRQLVVIPLLEIEKMTNQIESQLFDNNNWPGCLYYTIKNKKNLPSYTINYYEKPTSFKDKPKKGKKKIYLVLGWNGGDKTCNYKMADVLSFDNKDPYRVVFGADIFYFQNIPKFRAVFKYSEYAPFSLNTGYVRDGIFPWSKKEMLVYDHMAVPLYAREMKDIWEVGPDGSYDALNYYKRKGYFEWFKNVKLAETGNTQVSKAQLRKIQKSKETAAKDMYGKDYKKYVSKDEGTTKKLTPKEMKKLEEEEKAKQEKAGIKINQNKKSK